MYQTHAMGIYVYLADREIESLVFLMIPPGNAVEGGMHGGGSAFDVNEGIAKRNAATASLIDPLLAPF